MVANATSELVGGSIFLAFVALLIVSSVLRIRNRRREETAVRLWCDGKGYAISRIESFNISLFATLMFWVVGWLVWWAFLRRAWRLRIYDEQGGEKTIVVRVRCGRVEETSSHLMS